MLFAGWADAAKTRYFAYEESPSGGAHQRGPLPLLARLQDLHPRRYIGTTSKTAVPPPAAPQPKKPDPVADGTSCADKQVYRIVGGAPYRSARTGKPGN